MSSVRQSTSSRCVSFESEHGNLQQFLTAYEASPHKLCCVEMLRVSIESGTTAATIWENSRISDLFTDDKPSISLLLIITDSDAIQAKAVAFKLRRRAPVIIIRWWDVLANLRRTYRNSLIFNRYTGINLFPSRSMLQDNNAVASAKLKLDNPVLLDQQELLGVDSSIKMFRHTLDALVNPQRIDIFGRKKSDYSHLRLTLATHFYCNQNNIDTVVGLLEQYASYSDDILDQIQFVVVDDASPIDYKIPEVNLNLTWIKINEDIRWNQAGARNLALQYARSNNVIISDIDHLFPEHTLRWLLPKNVAHNRFYKFYRKMPDGSIIKGHPNIFYLARSRWFQLFGTDEEYAGAYGAEDFRFVKNFKNHGTVQGHLPKKYYCEERQLDRAASYHSLVRDLSFNTPIDTRKRMESEYFGKDYGHSRCSLGFTWRLLLERERGACIVPKLDKIWRIKWWFRTLLSLICSS